mmetsp:Transcript_41299/g.109521  ORF Transcript_41299/g.109521 Transcript_41299/m.109521 type:complete len:372 (-) Transcript_41299:148-1263(-)
MVLPVAKLFRGAKTTEIHRQFHSASMKARSALETADCLAPLHDRANSAVGGGRMQLTKHDWFELYGLHEVATKGACTTRPPPWWTHKPRWKWQAWHAQGQLTPEEAKARFVKAVSKVPGYMVPASAEDGHWFSDFLSCYGLMPCFDDPAPTVAVLGAGLREDKELGLPEAIGKVTGAVVGAVTGAATGAAEAAKKARHADPLSPRVCGGGAGGGSAVLEAVSCAGVSPASPSAVVGELVGSWEQRHCEGLEPYLKRLGVGWPQRQAALQFKPKQSWAVEGGVPKMSMASPMGARTEAFPLEGEQEEKDLQGNVFLKTSSWEAGMLVARSRSQNGSMSEIVARRWIDPRSQSLVQETSYDGVTYTRIFERKS